MHKKYLALALVVLVSVIAVAFLFVTSDKKSATQKPTQIKTIVSSENDQKQSITEPENNAKSPNANQPTSGKELAAPYGSFVSNHKPGQNGSNSTELSQCSSTPGATCYIEFTKNGVVKTLPSQKIDSSGSTFWQWKIEDAGLSSGEWSISAIAQLQGQTKRTEDKLTLDIQ